MKYCSCPYGTQEKLNGEAAAKKERAKATTWGKCKVKKVICAVQKRSKYGKKSFFLSPGVRRNEQKKEIPNYALEKKWKY